MGFEILNTVNWKKYKSLCLPMETDIRKCLRPKLPWKLILLDTFSPWRLPLTCHSSVSSSVHGTFLPSGSLLFLYHSSVIVLCFFFNCTLFLNTPLFKNCIHSCNYFFYKFHYLSYLIHSLFSTTIFSSKHCVLSSLKQQSI